MNEKLGYRGYVSSRQIRGQSYLQRIQNVVIRDYAKRRDLRYLLSAVEFTMPGCYMMLQDVLSELPSLDGIIIFSAFMLPQNKQQRVQMYERILTNKCTLHTALEEMVLKTESDIERFEDLIDCVYTLSHVPLNDVYQTFCLKMNHKDPFVKALIKAI